MYDAFISYSHDADRRLAPALQKALHRFAKPWYALRALRVFRDETNLAASADLPRSIERALREARYLLLMASPEAAQSRWVKREIEYWLASEKPIENVLIVLTDGQLQWDDERKDFDWERTSAVPRVLANRFANEPLYIDLRWTRAQPELSAREPRLLSAVAMLAATIHGKSLDEISGEDVRQHRRTLRLARATIAALAVLAGAAMIGGYRAYLGEQRATARLAQALSATDALVEELAAGMREFSDVHTDRILSITQRSVGLLEDLAEDVRSRPVQLKLATARNLLAATLFRSKRYGNAVAEAEKAIAILDPLHAATPDDVAVSRALVTAFSRRAESKWHLALTSGAQSASLMKEAYDNYMLGSAVVRTQGPEGPIETELLHLAIVAMRQAGSITFFLGEFDNAKAALSQALESQRRLVGGNVATKNAQFELVATLLTLSELHLRGYDRPMEALEALRQALDIVEPNLKTDPNDRRWIAMHAVVQRTIGLAHLEAGGYAASLAAFTIARRELEMLHERDPADQRLPIEVAQSIADVGKAQIAAGTIDEGLATLEKAWQTVPVTPGGAGPPDLPSYWSFTEILLAKALAYERTSREATAYPLYAEALGIADHVMSCLKNPYYDWRRLRRLASDGAARSVKAAPGAASAEGKLPVSADCNSATAPPRR